jgi:hypothetical protein
LAALLLFVAELLLPILPHLPRFASRSDQRRHAQEAA